MPNVILCLTVQKPKNGKPVSDQWVPAFVITDDKGQPVGTVQVLLCTLYGPDLHCSVTSKEHVKKCPTLCGSGLSRLPCTRK